MITPLKKGPTIETFAALDGRRVPDFFEVTRREEKHVVRTRAFKEHGKWVVRARGDERGLVEQTSLVPSALLLPATVTFGWPLFGGENVFVLGKDEAIGSLEAMRVLPGSNEYIPLRRKGIAHRVTARSMRYQVSTDSALQVPLSVQIGDGTERRLVDMTGTLPRAIPAAHGQ